MAYGVSYFAVLLAQKTGLKLDAAVQAQVVVLAMMVVTALIHGTYNYLTHSAWGKKFDIFARYIS
jgi:proline racemase